MDRRSAFATTTSFVSIAALVAVAAGCSGSSDRDRVAGRDDALADCDAADSACTATPPPQAPCDDGTDPCANVPPCDPNDPDCKPCDPSVPPVPCVDCSPQQAFAIDPSCTQSMGFKWNGSGCEEIIGCGCKGASCNALWKTGDACKLAHESCPTGGGVDVCADLAASLTKLLPSVQTCSIVDLPPGEACAAVVPVLPAGCGVPANAQSPDYESYKKIWTDYASVCPLAAQPCPSIEGKVGVCLQSPDIDSTAGVCGWADGTPNDDGKS